MEEQTIGTFWAQVQFLFLFFSDRHTLDFLQMKCNPANKKKCGLIYTVNSSLFRSYCCCFPFADVNWRGLHIFLFLSYQVIKCVLLSLFFLFLNIWQVNTGKFLTIRCLVKLLLFCETFCKWLRRPHIYNSSSFWGVVSGCYECDATVAMNGCYVGRDIVNGCYVRRELLLRTSWML